MARKGPRTRGNLINPLHITRNSHLLRQLGGLRQKRLPVKVLDFEDRRARFGRRTLQFGRVDLDEPFRVEVFAEELANSGLDAENGLVGRCLGLGLSGERKREWLVSGARGH